MPRKSRRAQARAGSGAPAVGGIVWGAPLCAAAAGLIYLLIVGRFAFDFQQTVFPHHLFMADAMLHGQLAIRPAVLEQKRRQLAPEVAARVDRLIGENRLALSAEQREALIREESERAVRHDWAFVDGRAYGYWAPLTPVLMMPFVALFGLGISDRLVTALFGALNVGLFRWLLWRVDRAGLCPMRGSFQLALTLLLAFGTVHFWMACKAGVWVTVQIMTLTPLLAAMIVASRRGDRPPPAWLSGAFFGAAVLGRNIVVLLAPFFLVVLWLRSAPHPTHDAHPFRQRLRSFVWRAVQFGSPVLIAVALQGWYNYARFGSIFQDGLDIQIRTGGNPRFLETYDRYGMFSLHYLPQNLYYYFWNYNTPRQPDGRIWYDREGNSAFLVTPALLYLFLSWRGRRAFALAPWCGVLPFMLALLLYFATGWVQFGPRYLLEATPLLLLLVAIGMRGRLTHVGYVLIALAVAANLFGTFRACDEDFAPVRAWIAYWTLPALVAIALLARFLPLWLRFRRPPHVPAT